MLDQSLVELLAEQLVVPLAVQSELAAQWELAVPWELAVQPAEHW